MNSFARLGVAPVRPGLTTLGEWNAKLVHVPGEEVEVSGDGLDERGSSGESPQKAWEAMPLFTPPAHRFRENVRLGDRMEEEDEQGEGLVRLSAAPGEAQVKARDRRGGTGGKVDMSSRLRALSPVVSEFDLDLVFPIASSSSTTRTPMAVRNVFVDQPPEPVWEPYQHPLQWLLHSWVEYWSKGGQRGDYSSNVDSAGRVMSKLISWHWSGSRMAMATPSDNVEIYNVHDKSWERPALSSMKMRNITCLAFRPFHSCTLAVGCSRGVALWRKREVSYLEGAAGWIHSVDCLDWSPDGCILATGSRRRGSHVVLWDIASRQRTRLMRVSLNDGIGVIGFSPRPGNILLAGAARSDALRLWASADWSSDRWSDMGGPVSAFCWSSDGSTLLCAPQDQAVIHAIRFDPRETQYPGVIAGTYHLTESTASVVMPYEGSTTQVIPVLGFVRAMAWDPHDERLAVSFQGVPNQLSTHDDDLPDGGDKLVALFATRLRPRLTLTPIGHIRGPLNAGPPTSLAFHPDAGQRNAGAILAISWSDPTRSLVSFIQLLFQPAPK